MQEVATTTDPLFSDRPAILSGNTLSDLPLMLTGLGGLALLCGRR
ncbi:hypothetical protein [Roseobacter fucihabitans]|nr:hypothetical protein [Roseobacter litoralis]